MKKNKLLIGLMLPLLVCVSACNNVQPSDQPTEEQPTSEPEPDNKVQVIVMSGQSNMEGSTLFDKDTGGTSRKWLKNYLETREIEYAPFVNGIKEVQTSFRGYYPYTNAADPSKGCNASNKTKPMDGKFLATKCGMANSTKDIGPEIGMTHVIRSKATEEKPIFIIKSAFCGSGFSKSTTSEYNWLINQESEKNLWNQTKLFVNNNLELIKGMGFEPEIKAWCWHQGESDSDTTKIANDYAKHMRDLLGAFRSEFKEYAPEKDGEKIAFVDCTIYDGTRVKYAAVSTLNKVKKAIAEESEYNFIINGSMKEEGGLKLEIGGPQNLDGCRDTYHYTTENMFRLGEAYGNILVENNIIK